MAATASWLIVCLATLTSGAKLPGGEEPDPGQQSPTAARLRDQQHNLNINSSRGSGHTRGVAAMNDAHDHVGETSGRRIFVSGGDAEAAVRGGSSDSTGDYYRKKEHDSHAGYGDGGDDGHEEENFSHTGYGSDHNYNEYSYYDHAGDRDKAYHHEHSNYTHFLHTDDDSENSEKELLYWYGYEAFRNQGTNCSDIGDGLHLCFEDYDEDTDENGKCDNEDCDHSKGLLTSYFEREEDEDEDEREGKEGKHDINTLDEEYLISMKELDVDNNDDTEDNDINDDDVDDAMDEGDDDDDDVYLYVEDNDTSLLSLLNKALDPKLELPSTTQIENDSAIPGPENDGSGSGKSEPEKISPFSSDTEQRIQSVSYDQTNPSPPVDNSENVIRDEIVVLSDKQLKSAKEVACNGGWRCHGGAADDGEAGKGDENDDSRVGDSPMVLSANIVQPDLYFADDTPTIRREDKMSKEYISQNELKGMVKEFEDSIITENEERETAMHMAYLTSEWIENSTAVTDISYTNSRTATEAVTEYNKSLNFKISDHKTISYEEVYDLIMRSGQFSDEDKSYISSLEQLRRLVNRLGGLEALLEKPEVHHIVKRQVSGTEACVFLKRRRRRDVGEAGKRERASRARRGVSNVGKNLEQGNPRFRQLFSQYKTMCDFLSLSVFEK